MTGSLFVSATSSYTFTLNSDDGSQLFIDGSLVVDDGGAHPPLTVSGTATLTAGVHPFEVRFFECCGEPSGVDLTLPTGVSFAPSVPVPEPTSLLLVVMGTGVLCIWQFCFRRGLKRVYRGCQRQEVGQQQGRYIVYSTLGQPLGFLRGEGQFLSRGVAVEFRVLNHSVRVRPKLPQQFLNAGMAYAEVPRQFTARTVGALALVPPPHETPN